MTSEKQNKLDLHFLSIALVTSYNLSKDPSSKAGCVIVTPDGRQLCTGYNGFPPGMLENDERWARPTKYKYVIHSEPNALLNAPFDTGDCTAYVSWQPCNSCMGWLVAARIKRLVYYQFHPRYPDGQWPQTDQELFDEFAARMEVVAIPKNDLLEDIRASYLPLESL